jgi:cell division protein FtsW
MKTDRVVFTIMIVLVLFGITAVLSSSAYLALRSSRYNSEFHFLRRHIERVAIGWCAFMFALKLDYRKWKRFSKPLLLISLMLIALTLISEPVRNTRRYLAFGPFSFQPAEIARFAVVLYLADYMVRKGKSLKELRKGFLGAIIPVLVFCLILILQPNFGMLVLFAVTALLVMWIGGAKHSHIFVTVALLLMLFFVGVGSNPYAETRFRQFLDAEGSYQTRQARITVGAGHVFGSGLGKQKFLFLPWPHTDFIFATVAEETGFIVSSGIMILFLIMLVRSVRISRKSPCKFGYFLGLGLTSSMFLQAMFHIGVNLGVLPTTGLPLPFISYGGTALVMNMFAVGIILNIAKRGRDESHDSLRRNRRTHYTWSFDRSRTG